MVLVTLVSVLVILTRPVLEILSPVEGHGPVDFGLSLGDIVHPVEYLEHGRGNLGRGLSLGDLGLSLVDLGLSLGDLGLSLGDLVHGPGRGSCSELWRPADR